MKNLFPAILMAAAMGGCASGGAASDSVVSALDSLFAARYTDSLAPGGAVIIARGDTVIYERYFGVADLATGERVSAETLFNIASVSKQFTAAALLQQDIDIDAPACGWVPYTQPFWQQVTLAHLASHSSGIPDLRDRSDHRRCVLADDEVSLSFFPSVDTLLFAPGTSYYYLNPSFLLLARVVEAESGIDFRSYMDERIFRPLGMNSTLYFSPLGMPAHTAHAYTPDGDGWQECDYGEEEFFATTADGGIYSTARDMLRWERGLATGSVLPPERLALAYTPRVDVASSPWCDYQRRPRTWYALGWFVETDTPLGTKIYHTGDNGGFQAYVAKYPDSGLQVIVLENRHDQPRRLMAEQIEQILSSPLARLL